MFLFLLTLWLLQRENLPPDIKLKSRRRKSLRLTFHSCRFLPPCWDNWKALRHDFWVKLSRLTRDIKERQTVGQHKPWSDPRLTLPNCGERWCWGAWSPHPARVFSTVGTAASPPKLQRHFLMRARCRAEATSSYCLFCRKANTQSSTVAHLHISTCLCPTARKHTIFCPVTLGSGSIFYF